MEGGEGGPPAGGAAVGAIQFEPQGPRFLRAGFLQAPGSRHARRCVWHTLCVGAGSCWQLNGEATLAMEAFGPCFKDHLYSTSGNFMLAI